MLGIYAFNPRYLVKIKPFRVVEWKDPWAKSA